MSSYAMDVEAFISAVKKYPEIWDNHSEDNRYRSRRQRAWIEIARTFIDEFDRMSGNQKKDVFKKLQNKWRNIRDSYVRHKRRNYTVSKKGYLYAKHLTFLDIVYDRNNPTGEANDDLNDGDDAWPSDDDTKLKKIIFKSEFETKKELDNGWSDDDTPVKRKRNDTRMEFVETNFLEPSCSYNTEDEDTSFFFSILPAVREFSLDQKLEFRSDVLRLIKEYRKNGQSLN